MVPATNKHSVYRGSKIGFTNSASHHQLFLYPAILFALTRHPNPAKFRSILLMYDKTMFFPDENLGCRVKM